jgi:hypothetical protein
MSRNNNQHKLMHTRAIEAAIARSIASASAVNIRDTFFLDRRGHHIFPACFPIVVVLLRVVVAFLHAALNAAAPGAVAGDEGPARTAVAGVETDAGGAVGGLAGFGYAALNVCAAGTVTGDVEAVGDA